MLTDWEVVMSGDNYHTTEQAAARLGIDAGHVRRIAKALGIGTKIGERAWMFTDSDIAALRQRDTKTGRKARKENER